MNNFFVRRSERARLGSLAGMFTVGVLAVTACSPSSEGDEVSANGEEASVENIGISDEEYSLDSLIAAAEDEGPITVVDATGKIVEQAEAFTEKYGIEANGVKLSAQEQEQVITRENDAGNIQHDVFNMSDLASVDSRILPEGYGISWMPPDLEEEVPEEYQSPAITSNNPWVWVYNSDVYGETCPISNWWEFTDEEWEGDVSIPDPLTRNETMSWFNQIETHYDDLMEEAYIDHYGEALETDERSATAEWVKRLADNGPSVYESDTEAAESVGAPDQDDAPVGFTSTALFRENDQSGWNLGICDELEPWPGQLTPRVAVMASGTESPNASKLFVHYMMSGEGMEPQLIDGKIATNVNTPVPAAEPSNIEEYEDELFMFNSETAAEDFANLQDWRDLWMVHN